MNGRSRSVRNRREKGHCGVPVDLQNDTMIAQLQERIARLEERDRLKDDFLGQLAHEVGNAFVPVQLALQILKQGECGKTIEQVRSILENQVPYMSQLVNDLRRVGRFARGNVAFHPESVDLDTVISQSVEKVHPLIEERRHTLAVSLPETAFALKADPVLLERILIELLRNAAQYTPPGGHIAVDAALDEDHDQVAIHIRDSGEGIPRELLPHVFELFVCGAEKFSFAEGRLGVGLAVVRALAERHGGTVEARNIVPDHGAELIVRLPRSAGVPRRSRV